ncbi:cell wall associated fibronectin-binding protein [Staphylococcus aureus]|nr:cell wall associated fibronectin-binding protein [Staphylococcus aureus]
MRIANISNNATVSQADQTTIINSLTFTETVPNRSYARASANEITSKTVSNVSRTGNNANVTVTVTYQDGTTSTVTVPVKHVIPEIVAHSHYTVQGQDFPAGNGSSASDYFKLSNGSDIADATITWVSGQAPNKDNTRIGEDITVTAHILIDGETTPITKTATYKVVRTVPKHVFETARGVLYPGVSDMYDAKQYVKPVNNSWSTNAQHMNFQFVGTYGPNKDVVGISTRLIRVTYDNRQTEDLTILSKVKPDPPRIDANSVTYKAGLTNQEIKVNNVLNNSSVKLFKADNTPLNVTNITHGSGFSSVVTVSDALPNGGIKAKSSISMNNVTYTTQDEHGQVVTVTRNESVDSNDSATVTVTPQLQATTEGAVFIKGGDGFDFGHVERFIQNPPHGATVAWHDSPDTWKNTVGNTHKTAVVTLPNGQGTRNVEVPVKVYPVANAKAPSRDVKGQNLTNGTDAMNYITFDPNTNTNGITAAWANRQQPNNQQAGVQHLNVDVTYPGISAAKRVPVTVNVYQFEFPQTTYTTTVGGTLASGTQASGYAHMQNATGLPTDGFTYKWNRDTTGTNDANWSAMNKPNVAKVVNAKYDVIYNGHTFATSLPAKFVVKDVQPAKPTVTETAAGAITIAPGANQTVNTHAGNVTTYADKLVIKRNGNVVTTFTRRNNTSPWVKEASAATVAGIAGTNNGITVAAGTFNPADTIQVVATQGSGETVSDEQRSDDFTVVAPQPNQATTKIWQNGHIDITPNNPSGHLINPTQAMDIAYTEKVGNGAEHSKTINVVRGQNNQWTIANKPDYVTLDAQTGKVTFNANTIKPNSSITITPKAGTGHSVSSNPSTLTAPAAHTVNTTEIVKDYGSNVTAAEINNAVQVANKRTATIKNGTAMPTNLAGGSTTTIPVTVTYNDGSTEEVQESIFTKADKRELITAKNHLDDPVSTEGKKPGTITQYNNAMHNAQQQINTAKTEAQQVINNERATPQQVSDALTKVRAAQTKIDQAKALLQNKEDNSQLVTSKNNLQSSVNQVPSTAGMTQQSIDNYNAKKREAETEITAAQRVIDNGDATAQQISDEKHRVDNALTALNQAKHDLTADTHALEQAVQQLNRTGTTTGKKPASITAYNNSIRALQSDLTSAKNSANAIIQKPIRTVQEVQSALTNVNRVNERLTQAINQLVPLADNSALKTAKTKLDEEINKSVTTDGMTQSSIQAYENAKRAGQTESTNAQNVINNGDATDQQIAAEKTKVEEKYNSLKQAIAGLTPDLAPLQTAKTQLQNDIDQPTSTTGMTSASIAAFNEKLSAARTKIQEIDRVLASHPDVATIRQNVTAANAAKSALDQARNGLTVDKAPLENAKNQLQHSIDTQTSTTGMTQDSINAYNAKLTAARNKIQQINQVLAGSPTVEQINTNTSTANQAKSDLDHARQALTPDKAPLQTAKTQLEQSINQPTDTTGMTTASLNAYNQKLQAARQKLTEINQVLNGNPTVQNINDKVTEANQAKDQLNTARQGLTLDRQPALTTLHGASNLNQAQQNNFTQQINAAQNHAALETIKSNITALNTAMTKLKDSVADNNTIKSDQNYTDATPANKQAYDNAVNAAKGVIGETTNPTMDVNTVNQKAASVKSTKDALDGQQNLQRAKTEATNAITHASDLNQAQKNALTQQVNSAQNVQAVNDIKQTTQSLNTAMTGLKRGVANHNQVVQSDNYVNADTNKKNDYNNAYNHANDIINGNAQHPVITPSDVNNALSNVTSKEHALNGEAKLNAAKQEANTALGHLNNLNNAQRQNLQSQINGAHQIDAVNTIKQNATNLNSAMGNLRQAVADKDQVKRTEDYADADTAKQNAYNSAVSSAETIINQTTNPTMSVDDVNRATSAVTSNKNALNGYEKLAQSKTDAARAIDALPHLNNAQKADVKSKINAASNIAGVNTVKQQGTDLNTAMGNLQGAINDEQTTLNSQNYQDATPSKKTAYTNAVQAAKDILNKSNGQNKTKDQVTEAMNQVNSAKNNLDGTRLLDQAKQTAKQQLNNMTHLTTAQKDKLKQQVQQAQNVAGVDTVKSSANTLNGAMGTLRNSIQDNTATKNGQNYLDATERNKTNYNNAVDSANGVINATSNPNMDANAINQIATQVTSTKNALDGTHNLTQAKQTATNAIDGATNLNKAQKDALKAQVTSAQRVANVTSIQQTANELNTAMGQLQHGIDDENATKQTQKYRDAEQSKKTAYDQAVAAAKAILNKQTGSNSDKAAVDRALQQVTSTKDALNGDAKLAEAKAAAKQNLGTLNHITNAQRTDLEGQINQATTVDGVNTVKTNANTLDGAMNSLQGSINDKDATLRNQNYLDADESKRNAYTQAVTAAEGILNKQTGGNTSKADVDNALNAVTRAKAALNGADNLRNAKTSATNMIDGLPNLTQLQKDNLKHQVEQAQNVAGVNGVKDKGNTLNTAMGALRTSIQNDNTTKTSQNYLDASDSNKNNYNTAVNNANGVINATNNPNMDANAINGMANQVNTTKAALNGAQNLAQAKTNATNTINNAHDLNQKQKDALKTQVNNAQRVSDANNVQHTATELNSAMTALKAAIADKERTKASGNYVNADQEKRQAYDSKVTNAENIISGTPNATLTVNDVNSAASQVNAAKTALNGDNNLRVAKEHANNTIDGLAQLNNAQKAKLKEQVQSATTLDGVQTVKNSSQTLNTAMKGLRDSIANEATIKAGQNYTDASPNNRNEYDSAVTAAKAIINQTSNPTMEPNTITQVTSQVTTKEQALNGARNLAQAKTTAKNNLNNLTSINNAQKDALTRSIDGATTVAGVNQETAKATELNNAMHSLQNGINDETQTKQTQKYLDAEPSKKSAYDQAVNAAKAILTKASGQNVDKAAVEQALQNVNSTKTALNGDAKLNEAKAAAKQTLGTLTHINNAQRTALDNEITQATNVEGVNTVKAKAQQLDGAMGQLETSIRDKDTTLQSQNYQDADDAKRTAYSQAVNAAATILNKTAGGNTPKADVERAMQAVTQANTALNGIQNLDRAKQAANTAITNASDLNTKQKEALKAQVTSAGRVSAANGVEHTATELNTAMTALKRAIADKAETKASGNYVNADANKRQAYDEKVTAAENIVSGTPTPTLTPADVTNAATQVTNAKTQLNGNHNLEVAKQNANTAIDGLTSLNGPQKAKLKEQVGQATTLPNVQTVRDNAQTLNTAMKGLRDSIANEATIKAGQNYTDASQNKQTDYNSAVTAAKAIIGQTTSPSMNAQEINQAKDQVTAKQQALNGQENLRTAQTNAKQHLNGLSDLTDAQKDAVKRQIEGATHVNEVTQAQNNADALNTAMTNLKNGIQDQNTIKQGVNFTDADEAKRNAYTNAVTQAEQILNKAQGPNTSKDGVETALENVQRAKNELNGNQNVANAKTTAKNALNNLTSINNAQKEALKSQIEGATTVAGVNQVSTTASELNTAMSNLQNGINDEAATKAAQKYTDADREKQTAYNDAVTAAKTLLDKTAGSNDNKAAVEQALQRVNTAKTALNGDERLNEAKNTAKQQVATMSHLTDAQKANLTSQIESGTTVAGVQGIQANAGTLDQAMNQLRQSIASKDATKSSEDYQDANADLQNAYNDAVTNAEGIISATNNPEMNPDTINQKASQVNSAKSALNGDEKLAAAKQTAKSDIGRLTDLNNAQRTAANAEVDQAPNLAAVTAAKNKATSLNTAMGNLKHALAEKDNTKRSVNYTDADQPKQQAYDTAVTQAEAITNANGSNANETQVQAALNQLNQAKNDLNGDNKVAQAKESAKRALASYSNLNNAQSTAATSQIDNATTVAGVTAAQNTANELNTAMGQLQNGINDQNTVKQQVNFTDADQGKKDAYTNAVTNAQGILDKAHGQNMTKAQVEAALNQVTTAKNALNGDANVRQAKSDAKANLGTLTHLNNAQKQDLTSQIEGATTVNGVNGVKTKAQDLDGAMQRLQSAIANKDQTKASENYIDADPTKKTAFDNAITQAESYLNKDHGANKDKQAVEQAIQSVTSTENALNGDANLQRAKTEAIQAIDNLTHLNTPQKTALKQQVNAAQRVSGVTDLKNSATSLNNAMDQLKQAIADHDTIVASGNYTNASPDKQGAYTDAYNAAKNIVNGSPNVITNAADVTAATQRVNNAETGLNGDTNLATAKQQAKDALRQMTHLSDAQKQSITGQIDSATQVTGVQSVKDNATNLDNAMNQLRNSIANKDDVKASQPYVDADRDKQNAYNTAVTNAENIINATSQPTLDPSAVTQAANQVSTNKTALNGAQNLANKKQETTANINQLSHLNNAQKQDLNTQVTNAPNISTVNQVKTKAEQLDQAMERLINGIQDKDQVKQSVNFTDADPEKQTAYNNAVTAAENIINQANGTNANQSQVEAALSTVTTTKQALNGDRKVTDAKNNANQTLSTLDNLNNAQKGAVTGNINQAHTVAEVTQAIQTAQELNTAMGNLKNSLNDKDTTLGSQNFADADPEKKNAYNEAVHNAENILNKSTGTNVPKDQVEAAMNQVNATKAALNGTQNLEKAKQHANTAIDGLSHLTNAQKEALKQLVQQSTTVAEAQGNEQKANNVDAAMDKLRQSIADNATTKQNQNYTDASQNKKDAYNNAVTTAQGIIDQTTSPTLDPTVINQAAGQVSTTKNALNGNENLEAAKQQASQSLGSLDNLNNAQKQTVTDQINGAHTVDEANQIKQNAQNLNTAMGNLKQAIADKDATKATVNFTDADQAKQQAYNTAVTNAENIISKANGGNATQAEVEQAIKQVNAAKQALNGNANVQHAKDEATALINSSNDLNQAQKDALKQQVQNATTVAGVNNVKQTAQELNNAMTQLKQGIADKEQTKADGNFVNADPDKQNAYNQAVAKAEALISATPDVVVTPSEITAALNKVTQAKNDLNGNTNLATAKQNVQHAIDQLPNLNQAQRDEYSKQITQATLVPNVNAIQQAATTLNDAMTQLKQGIANKAQIKGSENYHDADTDKQTAYDNAVTKAEELLKQTTNPTMDPNTIQQALTKVNDTNQALNGNQKLADAKQDAKTTLGTLDHLNDAQKQALTTQVEQAPDIATVNNVKQNAQNLNNAMTNLNNALQDKTETLNSINFTDADQAKKDAYTNAVSHAEGILSKANGSNASQTEVEQAMQRVNEAKQALNGNDNVQRAKDAAKQVITNANDLNQAQKDALKQQVDAAQTVANVNTIKQTAQDLNQAMTQLKQGIADKDQTKANGNFVNADTDKQNAYNNAVAHAEQIISGTPNANVDPQQVAQALQQVNQAKGDLNGNHNLQVAKDNANTAIDQLPNLNQPQKTALKDQVSHAELVTGVNAIKQNADALNNAMGTLKQQIQANSQVPQSVDFTQADQDKQQAYNNAANQAQQIANGIPTPVLTPDTVTQAVTTMNQAKDALNGDEKLAQAKQEALANLDTLRDLNQPQRDALRNQINQAQALATVEQTKQNAQNVNTAMSNLKQGIANKDTVKASENYHDADADKQTAYTNAVSQAEGIINQTTNPTLNPDEITRALTQVTDAKNGLNGEAKLATEKQNAKDAVSGMTHLNDAQKQALKGQIDQSPEIATVNQVKQTATSLDQAMDQLSQAINDKAQTLADGNYLNADPDKQNAYKQAVAKAEALLNKQSGTNEVQAQVESITNEVNAAKQALNGNDNLANAKQQAKQQLANLTHLNDAQKQSFESQITQAPLVTDVTTINQKAQTLDHAMELLRNSVADNQTTLASEDYHDATAQRQNDYNQAVTAANNIINQTTSPTMNPDDVNGATTQVNNTKVALDGDENLAAAKQQANNRLDQLDHLNNAQKQQLQSQITQSSDIAAVNGHKQTAESLNTAMGNLINAIADHQAVEQRGNFINADTDKQTAYNTAVNEAAAMINKQTGQNANQTEVEQAITKVQTTLQALNGDHNLQVAKTNATQAIDALTSLNDPQKTALKDQVTAATLVTAVHQIEQNANTLNQAMHGLRQSIQDNAATKANSKYINEDQPEQQNYDQAVQAANNIINEQTATLDNNAINQAATTVNTTKAALHGDVKLQNDKDHAKQTVSQLAHLNNAQKHMEDTLIDSETTRTAVKQDLTEAQALDQLMDALQQSIADKDATRASSAYVNAEPNKKQSYDEAVQNAESIIAGLNNPTINKGNVSSATQAVISSKNALDGVERLAQDKQTAGNSLNHLDQLTPAQQQALENQINNATTRGEVAQKLTEAQALNQAMEALRNSIQDQQQTEAGSKFINEDKPQKDAYQAAVQNAKDLINQTNNPTLDKAQVEQLTQAVNQAKDNLHGDQKLADDKQHAVTDLNQLNGLNNPQRQALESQINNAATRGEVAQKLAEAKALDQAMQALRNSIQDQQQTESGSKFINEDKPQKDAYQAAVQNAKDLINQTGNPTLDKSQVEQLTQAVTTAKDNLHGDQKLARDQQQAVTTVNALPNLNHAQQQALTDAINAAPTRTEVAQHVQTATELDHAMETLKNKVDQVNTDKAQPNYTEASTDKKEAVDQALQAAESITDPTNGSNANKDAVDQVLTKLQEKENELNGNERVAEAKTQAKQTIDQLTHLNADQIATAKQNIDQATKLQPIAELVDQATQLNQSMDQLQQAVNEHANVEQTVDYTQADSDKQNAYKQAIADAENVLKQNANKQQVDQALQNILNAKQALNGDERVALAKTNGKHDIDQLNALNNAQQDGFKGRIDQSNDLNQIQQIVDEAKALNRAMDQLSQEITDNEGRTKGSTNYVNADTQVKQVYDETVDKAKQALDKSTGQNLTAKQVIKLNDAVTAAKKALNGEERLNNRKAEALQRLDQLTHLNNAQRQLAIQQINNAETLNKASRAINRATKLDNAMGAVQQYIDEQHLGVISSTNYINADDNLKANYDNAIANAAHELDKVQGNAIAKAEAEQLKQNIIDAQNALNGDQNLANAKDKANAFVNSLNGLNQQQQDLAHKAINNADTVSDVTDIVNNQIDLNDAMETLKHLVDNEIPNAEQTVNYQNADDNAKTNFDDAKRLANTLLNSDNTNVNDINGAIQAVNDAIHNLNGDQRLQDAKDKAIQSINQALANKLKEIEASNATDQDKLIAKNKAEELANSIINNINKATSNQAVSQVQTAGNHAIEQVHANEIPKAKIDANKDVDKQVQALIDEIDRNPNLTDKEKQALKDRINQILQQGHNGINNAMTKEEIEQAKAQLAQALQDIKDLVKAKEDAKQDVDKQVQALIDEIDQNPNLTDKEKQALKDRINQILQQGHNDINNALTKEEIEQAKAQLAQALQDIKDLVKAKEDAKNAIKALANAKRDQINSNPDLTPEQKAKALKEIDEAEKRALQNVENAQTIDQLNRGLNLGLDDIRNTHVWEVDEQPAVNEIFEATPEQILVNGELIVHRDDIITEQDILAHINLIDQLSAEVIDTPSTATISDSLTAKVEVTLLDGSKVIVNVPVKVVEKELSVVKQQAIESIENAAQQKINEINNSVTLTLEQKEAAIAEVNKLKQQAIDHVNNAPDVHSVEEIQQQEQAHIEQFNPEQFTIEQAKSNAIKSIEDAIQHMIDEIKARTDLTDKEKQEAIAKLNQLKEQAIQAIQRAQSIDEISEQLEQFKAQMKAANPTAKELAKRKQEAISRIKDFSNEKINSIRNSEIGTADEKQAAMNQINEIVLETIRDINNAHTLQQVEAALNNGIARISAVQIVTSDRAKQSSSTGNESNSHLTIGYGTANHPFNSSTIGHKKKLDEDDDIDPLHMRHFSNNFGNVIKNAIGVVGISGLLASFWFFIAKRRRKEDEEEELEIRDNNKDSIKETLDDTKHLPLLFAKRRRKEDEEDVTVEEKDSLNNGESLDKVKHTPFFLPKRRRKEDEEDVEVTNENTDEKVLKDNEHSPLLFAKRRKDKEEDVETTTSIESKDEDVPLLLAKKKNQKDNQSKDKKSASKNTSKKVAAKKKKKKAKKNKK